jgi:hypothetical protein
MDHNCDSFYNSQQRISRFPGLVYAGTEGPENLGYTVTMTGTAPKRMKWRLDVMNPNAGFTVKIVFEDS